MDRWTVTEPVTILAPHTLPLSILVLIVAAFCSQHLAPNENVLHILTNVWHAKYAHDHDDLQCATGACIVFTCFASVFHRGLIWGFSIKTLQCQFLILCRHFGILVQDIYWWLVSLSAFWVGWSPALIWTMYTWGRQQMQRSLITSRMHFYIKNKGLKMTFQREKIHFRSISSPLNAVCTDKSFEFQSNISHRINILRSKKRQLLKKQNTLIHVLNREFQNVIIIGPCYIPNCFSLHLTYQIDSMFGFELLTSPLTFP